MTAPPPPDSRAKRAPAAPPSAELIVKYSRPGPRYTSYPPAPYWTAKYHADNYKAALGEMGQRITHDSGLGAPGASIYVHIPFCEHRCTFCACNVIISRAHERGPIYLGRVMREMDRVGAAIGVARPKVRQIHWGGGTPTWLSASELAQLQDAIAQRFELTADREQSIEIDPRVTTLDQLAALRERGLNRVSLGVQDLDHEVQEAIHRIQPLETAAKVIDGARSLGIEGVNVDLVYGLPHQKPASFAKTIAQVIALGVDRVALYNFAYLPDRLAHHRAIKPEWLPSAATRVELFRTAAACFAEAGYEMIGLDHFARGEDELSQALRNGTMQRNFMGYTTRAGSDLLAFGVSSISRVGRDFAQNVKTTDEYEESVEGGAIPIERGLRMTDDDLLRESVIQGLMCYGRIDFAAVEARHGVDLLAGEKTKKQLDELSADGLIDWQGKTLRITDSGRYFLRNVAMVFDAYLGKPAEPEGDQPSSSKPTQLRFSRTV